MSLRSVWDWVARLLAALAGSLSGPVQGPPPSPAPPDESDPTVSQEPVPGSDAINPCEILWDAPLSPACWPVTVELIQVKIDRRFISATRIPAGDTLSGWGIVRERGWRKPAIGNWWIIAKVGGRWRGTTIEWLGVSVTKCQRKPTFPPGHDDIRGPLSEWYPAPGEQVGIMQSSFGGRDGHARGTKNQRSNIVLATWPEQ